LKHTQARHKAKKKRKIWRVGLVAVLKHTQARQKKNVKIEHTQAKQSGQIAVDK
jgi:hypothetical protein